MPKISLSKKIAIYGTMLAAPFLSGCSYLSKESLEQTLESRINVNSEYSERQKYAVLINGDSSRLHKYNISHAYETLMKLGFKEENIFVLSPYSFFDEINNPSRIIERGTKENLSHVLNYLSIASKVNDLIVLYTTGHGSRQNNQSFICLEGPYLSAEQYRYMLEKIPAGTIVSVMDQCYSGGFVEELSKSDSLFDITAVSSTDSQYTTYCQIFSENFWNAFLDKQADSNKDGSTSVEEAYNFALQKHQKELSDRPKETNGLYLGPHAKNIFLD